MKLSIVLSTQPASFSALAFKGQIEENIKKIKQFGYDGVELAVRDPKLLDMENLLRILHNNDISVPAIGTGQAFGEEGLSFTHREKNIRQMAVERIKSQVEFAAKLNAVVIIGLIRGQHYNEAAKEETERMMIEALRECAGVNKNIKLAIEPINRYESEMLNTVEETLHFIEKVKMDNVGLLLDTFHMNIEEPCINDSIIRAKDRLFHFHVADSNRWYPGAGHIDFAGILKTLLSIGYDQYVSGEMLPLPDPDTSAIKMIEFLRSLNY